jgi:hypothetical protein
VFESLCFYSIAGEETRSVKLNPNDNLCGIKMLASPAVLIEPRRREDAKFRKGEKSTLIFMIRLRRMIDAGGRVVIANEAERSEAISEQIMGIASSPLRTPRNDEPSSTSGGS